MRIDRRTLLAGMSATLLAPKSAGAVTVKDATGRTIQINEKVQRVFPAGPPAAILLYTLAPDLLLGWPRANRPEECEFMMPHVCTRQEVGRITGRGNTANMEVVLSLKPDLILDIGSTAPTFASLAKRVQDQTGVPYALLDGRFDAAVATYKTAGDLVGRSGRAFILASYAEQTMSIIKKRIASIPEDRRPSVYYARGPKGLETGLGGSINVETIEFLGVRNVAAERTGGLATVSIEQILLWNPDVIITIDMEFAEKVKSDPVWAPINAVRNGRVHLSPKLPFGWVDFPPGINRLIGLWWLAKIIYPEQFPEDIRRLTRDFYQQFYNVTLSTPQLDRVLAGRD